MIEVELDPAAFQKLSSALNRGAETFLESVADRTATVARISHGYTTRTGRMEASTLPTGASGSFDKDTLQSATVGFTPYASFLESRRDLAFLRPAWEEVQSAVGWIAEQSFESAFRAAGW